MKSAERVSSMLVAFVQYYGSVEQENPAQVSLGYKARADELAGSVTRDLDALAKAREAAEKLSERNLVNYLESYGDSRDAAAVRTLLAILRKADHG